ncbi:MAG TPA: hypothetical protein VHQ95_10725 [Pyrinomonadaceae bacterium]|nr:hypothetical protein [Pyrinomonadaceae bacterium]
MKALRLLLREELQAEVRPLQNEMSRRFDEVATQIDGLYQRDESGSRNTYLFANRSNASKSGSLN